MGQSPPIERGRRVMDSEQPWWVNMFFMVVMLSVLWLFVYGLVGLVTHDPFNWIGKPTLCVEEGDG